MTISSTNRKAGPFIGNDSAATFPFTFKVFQASEVEVVRLEVATTLETVLLLTTDYTVSLNQDQDSNPGGSITLVAGPLATGFNLVVTSDLQNLQPTDLTNQGGFYPEVINDALDRATIQIQQLEEKVDRSAKLPITSAGDADQLVADIVRIADSADNLDTVAINIDDVNTTADDIANINTVAGSIANVNTTAGSIANVNTVAGDIAAVNTVAADLNEPVSEIEVVANSIANVNTVGGAISNVNTVATNIANVNTVAGISTNVTTVANNTTNVNTIATNIADVQTVANDLNEPVSEIETVAASIANVDIVGNNIANVNTVAANNANVTAVGTNIANVNTVAGDITNVNTVATNQGDVNIVAANIASVNTAASDIADIIKVADDLNEAVSEIEVCANNIDAIDTVGEDITNVNTVATNIANVNTVAGIDSDVSAVAGISANVTTVANNDANVTTVAGISSDVTTVAGNNANVTTVAGISGDVTTVAGVATDIPTVAANVTDITNFADVYLGPKTSNPATRNNGSALQTGDLYFNTTADEMRVYTGSAWKATGSAVNGTSIRQSFTATAGQTTFVVAGGYDSGFADVYLNGVKLVNGVDVTVTSGTDVVLTTGAVVGDSVDVVAYGAFEVSDTYTQAATNGLLDLKLNAANPSYTGTLTGGTGVINIGSGQFYKDVSGDVSIGTSSPTANTRLNIVSPENNQQYVDVLKLKTSFNGDYHPSILFENNRNLINNAVKIAMDSSTTTGSGQLRFLFKDSSGTFLVRAITQNDGAQFSVIPGGTTLYPEFKCRAWVNFNGTGTVAIRASGNVSSITDNGTGDYRVNFATAMPDANYAANCFSVEASSGPASDRMGNIARGIGNYLAGSVRVVTNSIVSPGTLVDQEIVVVSVFR